MWGRLVPRVPVLISGIRYLMGIGGRQRLFLGKHGPQHRPGCGETGAIDGTLTVDDSFGGSISRVVNPAMEVAGVSVPETQIGALDVTLTGELSQGGTTADTNITLGGSFFGDAGQAALGPVVGGYKQPDSTNPAVFDGAIEGTYYIEQE